MYFTFPLKKKDFFYVGFLRPFIDMVVWIMQREKMAGKSNKGRNRKGSNTAAVATAAVSGGVETAIQADVPANDNVEAVTEVANTDAVEVAAVGDGAVVNSEVNENEAANEENQPKQGESGSRTDFVLHEWVVEGETRAKCLEARCARQMS